MTSPITNQQLSDRITQLEALIGCKINEPYTTQSISQQILNIKDLAINAASQLSQEIKKSLEEGKLP